MDKARKKTDKLLEGVERRITGFYDGQYDLVFDDLNAYLDDYSDVTDEYISEIKKAETAKEKQTATKSYRDFVYTVTIGSAVYKTIVKNTSKGISRINQKSADYLNKQLGTFYDINFRGMADQLSASADMKMTSDFIQRNLKKNETNLPYKYIDGKKDVRWNTQKINAEVMQGIINGESIPKIAERFERVLGMNEASAVRNARTAVTCTENRARLDMLKAAKKQLGINTRKVWSAVADDRTREAHLELDGAEEELEVPFVNSIGEIMMPGDPDADASNVYNCRCTLTYHIVSIGKRKL